MSSARKNIVTAFFLNLSFAVVELIGGVLTNSVAILSDAVHDFGDSLSLGVAWYLQKISEKKGDSRFSYGYKRFSLLGSIFISTVLLTGSFFIINESIKRLRSPQEAYAPGMLLLSVLGIIVNGAAVLRLKKGKSHNEKAVMIHMMEDVLGWAAVFVASILMIFFDVPFMDPLLSLIITGWVLFNVIKNLKSTFSIMLQQVPSEIDMKLFIERVNKEKLISSVHDVHLWTLDGESHILTLHVVIGDNSSKGEMLVVKETLRRIAAEFGIEHVTVEIEFDSGIDNCIYNREQCG